MGTPASVGKRRVPVTRWEVPPVPEAPMAFFILPRQPPAPPGWATSGAREVQEAKAAAVVVVAAAAATAPNPTRVAVVQAVGVAAKARRARRSATPVVGHLLSTPISPI